MAKKILIDTDLLVSKNITITEYVVGYLANLDKSSFSQLVRYHEKFNIDSNIIEGAEDKGLVSFTPSGKNDHKKTVYSITSNDTFVVLVEDENTSAWISEWVDLWPKGIKTAGYRVRPSLHEASEKMRKFRNIHKEYTKETIMGATKDYIQRFAAKGYDYIKVAKFFVLKNGESVLADECEAFLEEKHSPVIHNLNYGQDEL